MLVPTSKSKTFQITRGDDSTANQKMYVAINCEGGGNVTFSSSPSAISTVNTYEGFDNRVLNFYFYDLPNQESLTWTIESFTTYNPNPSYVKTVQVIIGNGSVSNVNELSGTTKAKFWIQLNDDFTIKQMEEVLGKTTPKIIISENPINLQVPPYLSSSTTQSL